MEQGPRASMGPAAWKSIPGRGKSQRRSSEAGCGLLDPGERWERGPGRSRAQSVQNLPGLSQGSRCYSERHG